MFAVLRLLPTNNRDRDIEVLVLRHQIMVLQRQLGNGKVRFDNGDRAPRDSVGRAPTQAFGSGQRP
ncbi:hypothetical protein [Dactylosporangium darangshiense]|uniref:hypothetical protein n=1 Tax=Dactylosporangium darangshiense TaxID=579108 RepID=UPI003644858B